MGLFWSRAPRDTDSEQSSEPDDDIEADRPVRPRTDHPAAPPLTPSSVPSNDQPTIHRYQSGRIYALLTGNSASSTSGEPPLTFVYHDLKRMQETLERCKIEVHNPCLENGLFLTRQQLFDVHIKNAKKRIVEDKFSCFMFYFTGHGDSTGISLSSNTTPREVTTYEEIIQFFGSVPSIPKIFIFDCCRLTTDQTTSFTGLPDDCFIVFACMDDCEAWGRDTIGSYFTNKLANALNAFYCQLTLPDIITQAVNGTKRLCETFNVGALYMQNPVVLSSLQGQFEILQEPRAALTSYEEVMQNLNILGKGVSVLIIHAPDPMSAKDCLPVEDAEKEGRIKQALHDVITLACSLEQHGFSVLTDLDADCTKKVQWYNDYISKSRFVLLVCSPALNYIFSSTFRCSDHQVNCIRVAFNTICNILSSDPDTDKFIPVAIDPAYQNEQSFFHRHVYYAASKASTFEVERCTQHKYGYESLVCKMAAIDITTIGKSECQKSLTVPATQSGTRVTPDAGHDTNNLLGAPVTHMEGLGTRVALHSTVSHIGLSGTGGPTHLAMGNPQTRPVGAELSSLSAVEGHLSRMVGSPHAAPVSGAVVTSQSSPLDDTHINPAISPQQILQVSKTQLLERKIDQRALKWLSEHIREWQLFARYLGSIRTVEIKRCTNVSTLLCEQCFEMLKAWNAAHPHATYKQLWDALGLSKLNQQLRDNFLSKIQELGDL